MKDLFRTTWEANIKLAYQQAKESQQGWKDFLEELDTSVKKIAKSLEVTKEAANAISSFCDAAGSNAFTHRCGQRCRLVLALRYVVQLLLMATKKYIISNYK